jgi:hypothetical protein
MLGGVLLVIGVELCLFVAYLIVRAKKELKEEKGPSIIDEHFFI